MDMLVRELKEELAARDEPVSNFVPGTRLAFSPPAL